MVVGWMKFPPTRPEQVNDNRVCGYLVVEKYESLYERYRTRYNATSACYAIPRLDIGPESYKIRYRGIDRDCLVPYEESERNLAEIRMYELLEKGIVDDDDFVPAEYLDDVFRWLEEEQRRFETIFVKKAEVDCVVPQSFRLIGYEPSYFYSDHFSASCDCMMFPRWHGTDEEWTLFLKYFNQLNPNGLFDTPEIAKEFLEYYLSFDWTERGDFYITAAYIRE
jgi:hypothetical protein